MSSAFERAIARSDWPVRIAEIPDLSSVVRLKLLMIAEESGKQLTTADVAETMAECRAVLGDTSAITLLADANGGAVGLVQVRHIGDFAEVAGLYVCSKYRHHGVGISLIRGVVDIARAWNAKRCRFLVNAGAELGFYQRHCQIDSILYTMEVPDA